MHVIIFNTKHTLNFDEFVIFKSNFYVSNNLFIDFIFLIKIRYEII